MLPNKRFACRVILLSWIIFTVIAMIIVILDIREIVALSQGVLIATFIVILAQWLVMFLLWVFGGLK